MRQTWRVFKEMASEGTPKIPSTSTSTNKRNTDLEILSLNYLRSQNISIVPDDNNILKLQPCKHCNKAISDFVLKHLRHWIAHLFH